MEPFREPMAPSNIEARLDRLEDLLLVIIEMLSADGDDEVDAPSDQNDTLDNASPSPLPLVMDDEL